MQPQLPELIIIDEPELGLHPYAISVLAGLLKSVSYQTQIIVSTQSVTLVDQLEPEHIIVVDREKDQSIFRRLDDSELRFWLEEYSLGKLWEKNVLGGRLRKGYGEGTNSNRFIPYIQLHEFEALLSADIYKMKSFYLEDKNREIECLKAVANGFDSPELINEGNETAPSKQIIREIPDYYDNKVLIGPTVAKVIGLTVLRERCTHFKMSG